MRDRDIRQLSREILARHSRSFSWASRLLPEDRRDDAAILYAFCRQVDDSVDEADNERTARDAVDRLRAQLDGDLEPDAVTAGFLTIAERLEIELDAARELIRGVASDLGTVRFDDDRDLFRYCYRVAGTVGLMMAPVVGADAPQARAFAVDLGVGMQLTNICRDVLEDAGRGRVYLPATRLRYAGTSQQALLEHRADEEAVAAVVRDLLEIAERYYESARAGMAYIPLRSRVGIMAASRLYRSIGRRLLREHDGNPMHGRTVVPWWEKTARVAEAITATSLAATKPSVTHDPALHRHLDGLPGCNPPPTET
jgi:phytoene synthase